MFIGERGDIELVEILGDVFREMSNKFGGEKPMFTDDPVVDGDVRSWSTRNWKTTDERRALLAVVEKAPADAFFVAAAIDERDVEEGLVYVHVRANRLIVVLEGRATSAAAADKAFASLRDAEDKLDDNRCWRRYGRASTDREDRSLSFVASFDLDDLRDMLACLDVR